MFNSNNVAGLIIGSSLALLCTVSVHRAKMRHMDLDIELRKGYKKFFGEDKK